MFKKSLLSLSLIAAMSAVSLSAQAATYHVVVPAPGKEDPDAAINLELRPAILPVGLLGDPIAGFDFNSALRITGDPDPDMSQVAWSVYSGALSSGLSLSREGSLYGMPTEKGESSFQLRAKYKTKSALGTFSVSVNDITLALDVALPQAHPQKAYHYSLAAQLSVDGDPNYTPEAVSWSLVDGTLPSGLSLTAAGEVSGIPEEDGVYPITVQASYKGRSVSKVLQLDVVWTEVKIQEAAGTRYWEDGTYAQSCKDYIQPSVQTYIYAGATGDGIYRIAPGGIGPFDVRCDMTSEGGGWTLVEYTQDLAFKAWFPSGGNQLRWLPSNFSLKLTSAQINAIRTASTVARQRYVGLCEGAVHYYYLGNYYSVGFRFQTGIETNSGSQTYSPATIKVIQDGCAANGGESGRLDKATIFDIENINLPVVNIVTIDNGEPNEYFGSPLTQYPARFR